VLNMAVLHGVVVAAHMVLCSTVIRMPYIGALDSQIGDRRVGDAGDINSVESISHQLIPVPPTR